ncbi:MAG: transcription antitermination factor NusB [Alphaproteobacteria bacterium]|nr:transcription antitermination factor NusB [Alphaproteobacteria bacterium]
MTPTSGSSSGHKDDAAGPGDSPATVLSAARLAAVQALYQIALADGSAQDVIEEFVRHRLGAEGEEPIAGADRDLFVTLVEGVAARGEELDSMIAANLADDWKMERIQPILLAVLKAGTFELLACARVPPRVVITEYVDIAHAFFEEREPAFVNAVLDRLAHALREDGWEG